MKIKQAQAQCLWIVLLISLAACETTPPQSTATIATMPLPASTLTQAIKTSTVLPTFTSVVEARSPLPTLPTFTPPSPQEATEFALRQSATPTDTALINTSMIELWLTRNALTTPIRTPVVLTTEKSSGIYIKDGNVFFRDITNQLLQLTSIGKDRDLIISDDGKKIAFYRGEVNDNIHYINLDGGQEDAVTVSETPLLIGQGEIVSPTFVSGTHILMFNTYLCGPRLGLYNGADCTVGVYTIDTDSGEVEKVVNNLSGSSWKDRNFEISPNGKYVSVAGSGHINIYAFSSGQFKLAYWNAIPYYITTPDEFLPEQYWLPNSNGLIAILAADGEYDDPADPPFQYVAFRYVIQDGKGEKIPLDKFIIEGHKWGYWSVSPDRNWILFLGNSSGGRRDRYQYLGNLNDGRTQLYNGTDLLYSLQECRWSPDSKHFVSDTNTFAGFIGSVDGSLPVPVGGYFVEWIDATHYYYETIEGADSSAVKTYIGRIGNK